MGHVMDDFMIYHKDTGTYLRLSECDLFRIGNDQISEHLIERMRVNALVVVSPLMGDIDGETVRKHLLRVYDVSHS
jgi:hypothetical protein